MTTSRITLASPFRWLMKALDSGRKQPRALIGGFALMLLVAVLPSVPQVYIEHVVKPPMATLMAVYGAVMVFSLLVVPPVMGGALRLLHRCELGQPAAATDVFEGYRDGGFARRMIGTALLCMLVYLAIFAVLYLAMPSKDFVVELFARSMATPPGGQPDMAGMPPPSGWLLLWFPVAMVVLFVSMHGYLLAYLQAALGGRGAVDATVTGFAAMLRYVLPFAVFTAAAVAFGGVLVFFVAIIVILVLGLLAMVSPVLAVALAVPVYLGLMLVMYVVMFGFYYHAWRDIFGEPAEAPADALEA